MAKLAAGGKMAAAAAIAERAWLAKQNSKARNNAALRCSSAKAAAAQPQALRRQQGGAKASARIQLAYERRMKAKKYGGLRLAKLCWRLFIGDCCQA